MLEALQNERMVDSILLLVCGIGAAALAWGFWVWLGEYGVDVLLWTSFLIVVWDNRTLRKKLKAATAGKSGLGRDAAQGMHRETEG